MIIFLLIIAAIATFVSMTLISKTAIRMVCTGISAVIVVASAVLMIMNDREHFGMHKVTETTTTEISSVSPSKQLPMLLYKKIGTDEQARVYLYKNHADQKKPNHTETSTKTTNRVKTSKSNNPTLVKKTTRWVYKNDTYRLWFGIADNNRELSKRVNTFELPQNWVTLSTEQAAKLQKLMKHQNQKQVQADAAKYVKAKVSATVKSTVAEAMKKNPKMSASDRQKLIANTTAKATKQFTAQYQNQMIQKLIEQVK